MRKSKSFKIAIIDKIDPDPNMTYQHLVNKYGFAEFTLGALYKNINKYAYEFFGKEPMDIRQDDMWVQLIIEEIEQSNAGNIVVTGIWQENEIRWFQHYGFVFVRTIEELCQQLDVISRNTG